MIYLLLIGYNLSEFIKQVVFSFLLFRSMGHSIHSFVTEGLKKDVPSGQTPARINRDYPRNLVQGTPDNLRLEKHRNKRGLDTPAKFSLDNIGELDDADSVVRNTEGSSDSRGSNS